MPGWGQRPWTGEWIWCQEPWIRRTGEFSSHPEVAEDSHDRRVLFRRGFDLAEVPAQCPLRITADSRYVVWVNGIELARGPARCHPWRLHYDTVDAASVLRPGRNLIAVLVRFYGRANAWWVPATPTFSHGAGVLVAELGLPGGVLGTDRSWRCVVSDAWTPQRPRGVGSVLPEVLDGGLLDPGWITDPDFDESGWQRARVLTALHLGATGRRTPPSDPYGPLGPSPLAVQEPVDRLPERITAKSVPMPDGDLDPVALVASVAGQPGEPAAPAGLPVKFDLPEDSVVVVTADWGRMVAGTLDLHLDAAAGVVADARMAEELDDAGGLPPGTVDYAVRYRTRGSRDRFESADPTGGRYAVVVLRGPGRVTLRRLAVRERHRPRPAGPYFECADPVLERIYQVGLRTVDLTAQDAYVDCPTREQRAWTGDAVVHQAVDLLANPDWSMAHAHARLTAAPRPDGMLPMAVVCDFEHNGTSYIPDWALHWIRSVHNLWRWTGDADLVSELLPVAENVLRWFARYARDGLLTDVSGWVLLDWASVQGRGTSAVLNGLWGRALLDFAEMADWLGDAGRSRWARATHTELYTAYQIFWDQHRGTYRDWLREDDLGPQVSEHAAAAAVVGGLVPQDVRPRLLSFLLDRGNRVPSAWSFGLMPLMAAMGPPRPDWDVATEVVAAQPFFRHIVHDAVAALGGADHIAGLCRDWQVFLDAGETTWPETWAGGSHCHGWSSTPSRDLPLYTLGVSPAEPGFTVASIAPRLGELDWARGAVPTPHGLISVSVEEGKVRVDCPVPFDLDLGGGLVNRWPAGTCSVERHPVHGGGP